jgi:hypothetical protein
LGTKTELPPIGEACRLFMEQIGNKAYYDAHETLEEVWYPRRFEKDDETLLIKGFINASVAFELVRKGRMAPAEKTWQVFLKYRPLLKSVQSPHLGAYRKIDALLENEYADLFGA